MRVSESDTLIERNINMGSISASHEKAEKETSTHYDEDMKQAIKRNKSQQ